MKSQQGAELLHDSVHDEEVGMKEREPGEMR